MLIKNLISINNIYINTKKYSMIKKFDEFVNEGLLDIFSGDGCKNLEGVCKAFAKRLSKVAPIKYKYKGLGGKIWEGTLDYSSDLNLEYISADDDLVIDFRGKRTIKEEARRITKMAIEDNWSSDMFKNEGECLKYITRFLYKTGDFNAFGGGDDISNKTTAIFTFSVPYLEPVKDEKGVYERKTYYYTTYAPCKTRGRDDKDIATHLLNTAFFRLYKGLTDPEDKFTEFTDSKNTSFKDVIQFIPSELINAIKAATKRKDLK